MIFLSFLAYETMVGYSPARLLPLAWESPERCNLFGLLGNFQRCLQCGSENSLISYGISRWQISVCLQAFSHSLHLQPSFFRWLHHPSCGLDLPLLLHRLCRLGQGLTAQVFVQVLILTIVYRLVEQAFPKPCF